MVRHLLRPLWVLLALLFFVEAWLWDHLQPVVARVVALIPFARLKRALGLGLIGLFAFLWALRRGQYTDLDGAAYRILSDDDV